MILGKERLGPSRRAYLPVSKLISVPSIHVENREENIITWSLVLLSQRTYFVVNYIVIRLLKAPWAKYISMLPIPQRELEALDVLAGVSC